MEPYDITRSGESEVPKALVHMGICSLAVTALAYQLVTLHARAERNRRVTHGELEGAVESLTHLKVNSVVYLGVVAFEVHHVLGHVRR